MNQLKTAPDCPFCNAAIQDNVFMQSAHFLAICNHAPIVPGHSLVIPRRHESSVRGLSQSEAHEFIDFSKSVTELVLKVFKTEAFNWTLQETVAAGQTIEHMHLHIIPRHKGDFPHPGDWYPKLQATIANDHIDSDARPKLNCLEMKNVVNELRRVSLLGSI
jgi:bis(5'-adenosyl)-triphosphatase